jgi:hypothetical protein
MIKRALAALESIAKSLCGLAEDVRAMRAEQEKMMELSRREAEKGPERILEMVRGLMGPKG